MEQPLLKRGPLRELARILQGGANREDRPLALTGPDVDRAAEAIVRDLLGQVEYPRLVERHGLRFVCYLEEEWEIGSPCIIHVQRWDGAMWRNVGEVRAAGSGA